MGTHPIFESDFDCLTDLQKLVATAIATNAEVVTNHEANRLK